MRRFFIFAAAVVAVLLPAGTSQAGIFVRRNGEPRQPVRNTVKGAAALAQHCHQRRGECGVRRKGPWGYSWPCGQ